jgi:hypothetical protein
MTGRQEVARLRATLAALIDLSGLSRRQIERCLAEPGGNAGGGRPKKEPPEPSSGGDVQQVAFAAASGVDPLGENSAAGSYQWRR